MTIKEDRPERIVLEVDAEAAGPLVVLDLPYPGWKVTIDGEPAEGGVFEGMYRSVQVPAGHGRLLSWLHAHAEVLAQETEDTGAVTARIRIAPVNRGKLAGQLKRAGLS